jgi:hypothetical protein
MIVLFSLSQLVNVVISLYNYNKDYVSIFLEEENENNEECKHTCSDDKYYIFSHKMHPFASLYVLATHVVSDVKIYTLLSHKPETPPPNFLLV